MQQLDEIRSRRPVAWERKANAEFPIRLSLWRDFLEDYRQNPGGQASRYTYEVGRRVQLHILHPETRLLSPAYLELLASLDNHLRSVFIPGEFVWDAAIQPGFPKDPYWYLYGSIKK